MRTDILFINPGNQKAIYQNLAGEFTAVDTPIWTCLLAEAMRKSGYSVCIHDMNLSGWEDAAREQLRTSPPRLIVIPVYGHHPSASTQTMPAVRLLLQDIKTLSPATPIALGGTHPSALPERTLNEEAVDYILQGEGLHPLQGLMDSLSGKCSLTSIPGLWSRSAEGPVCSSPAQPIRSLDGELTDYAWDLLPDLKNYRAHNWHCFQYFEKSREPDFSDVRTPYASIYTSLGCPYNCDYCCIKTIFGKPGIKYWAIETVMGWIDRLVQQHHVKNIRIADELFILSPARVEKFCDLLIARGYDLNIWAYARIDTIPAALLPKMKKAGIHWLCLGIESGNEEVRTHANKTLRQDIVATVREIQAQGIYVLGNYMFGLPGDTLATMQETLDLALELNCEFANFYTVMAYPGSALYLRARTAGQVPDKWEAFSQHSYWTQPLPTEHLTAAQVQNFRDKAFQTYFTYSAYLGMIRKKFGPKVCAHIEKMVSIPIKRKVFEPSDVQY